MRPLSLFRSPLFRGVVGPASFVLAAALAVPALAASWSSFENTFPALPCQDGWAACVVDGVASGTSALKDAAGRPLPSDARFGWFDLKPTPNVSPFTSLSVYTGTIGGEFAPPPPVEPAQVADARPVEDGTAPRGDDRPVPDSTASTTGSSRGGGTTGGSTVSSRGALASNTTSTTGGGGMRPDSATSTTAASTTTGGMRPGSPSSTTSSMAPTSTAQPVSTTPTTTSAALAPIASSQDDTCDDLVKLEPGAMMGQLRMGQNRCLEARLGSESQQTTKDKISRLMITNAEAKGDKSDWERLMKRHLEDIDRSDPDLCFKYALHLSRGGTGRAQGVIRWADYSLENKARWSGQTYKSRVFSLYKLRAEAASKLWQQAEKDFAEGERTDDKEAKAAKYRGQSKDFAREWLDYAKASTQDTKSAMALCVSAAGNRAFCEGG